MPCFLLKTSEFDELVAHYIRVGSKTAFHFIDGVCHYIIPVLSVQVNDIQAQTVFAGGGGT
jgi:hypothetical protein